MAGHIDHDVLRLDVAVDVARPVDRVQAVAELLRDLARARGGERAIAAHERAQVVARDIAHHEVGAPLGDADAVNRHDVRMLDGARRARLAQEALAALGILDELGRDHLERDVAVELDLPRAVDDSHAAPPDDRIYPAPSEQRARSQHCHVVCISERPAPM